MNLNFRRCLPRFRFLTVSILVIQLLCPARSAHAVVGVGLLAGVPAVALVETAKWAGIAFGAGFIATPIGFQKMCDTVGNPRRQKFWTTITVIASVLAGIGAEVLLSNSDLTSVDTKFAQLALPPNLLGFENLSPQDRQDYNEAVDELNAQGETLTLEALASCQETHTREDTLDADCVSEMVSAGWSEIFQSQSVGTKRVLSVLAEVLVANAD
ncbi:MAG: hypothetical protein AAB425_11730 [Bdellovibrionota bacterium]